MITESMHKIDVSASGYFNGSGHSPRIDLIRLIEQTESGRVVLEMRGPHGMLGSYLCVDGETMDRLAEVWRTHRAQQSSRCKEADAHHDSGSMVPDEERAV